MPAAPAPDPHEARTPARRRGVPFPPPDGTLIPTDRVAARTERGNHAGYPGRHQRRGGGVRVLPDPAGFPRWVFKVRPGATHDLPAAREPVPPAIHPHAVRGLAVRTDTGHTGAGIRVPPAIPARDGSST